jgi:DNA replication and repair protein RecF
MLNRLMVRDFRCFETAELSFHPRVNVFVGRNAQGKTSLLEAICVLMRLQSPRTSTKSDWVRFEAKTSLVEGTFGSVPLRYAQNATTRRLAVDGAVCTRSDEYLKCTARIVWMDHADMNLVRGGAEHRRRFLDFAASQMFPEYRDALKSYERALRSRNYVLKRDDVIAWKQADAYAILLQQHGSVLARCREELLGALLPHTTDALHHLSSSTEQAGLRYLKGCQSGDLVVELLARREEEHRSRSTVAGPHRDDVALEINGRDATAFASEGQQRSLCLSMKIAQAKVLEERSGQAPLLLMDDIFGELDKARRQAVLSSLPPQSQIFITTTFIDWLEQTHLDGACFEVSEGFVNASAKSF